MRTRAILLLLCTVFVVGTISSAGAVAPSTLHCKVRMKSASFGDAGTREIWIKGNMMRCNMNSGQLPITVIKNNQGVYLIHPWSKRAGKYPDGSPRGNVRTLLPGPTGSPKAFLSQVKAKKLASQQVGKQLCDVYSYTEPVTKRNCKLWVDTKTGKPAKLWMQGKHKVMDELTATYVTFAEGAKISDSIFEVPKGYAIRPMPKPAMASKPTQKQPNSARTGI